jgi:hypothetical protein
MVSVRVGAGYVPLWISTYATQPSSWATG